MDKVRKMENPRVTEIIKIIERRKARMDFKIEKGKR